jgi:5-methylcytosine-specific restriction endonuclease McrA
MLNEPTLVLNRSWVAISTTTVRDALSLVYRGVARVIQPETYETHDFDSWADLAVAKEEPVIRTVKLQIRVPEVILLTRHDRMPERSVPFSRRNLYRRDGLRCQYCGRRQPSSELSIDHVVPRSRGGRTIWENCVLACIPCNVRKGNKLLSEAGMHLVRLPTKPPWSPCLTVTVARRRASWEKFVSEQYWNVSLEED